MALAGFEAAQVCKEEAVTRHFRLSCVAQSIWLAVAENQSDLRLPKKRPRSAKKFTRAHAKPWQVGCNSRKVFSRKGVLALKCWRYSCLPDRLGAGNNA